MANCPQCSEDIPENIPRIGELTYTCKQGHEMNGEAVRAASGFPPAEPEPEPKKPARRRKTT